MFLRVLLFLFAAGSIAAPAVADDEAYEIKLKKDAKGDKGKVTKAEDGTTTATIELGGQKKVTKQKTGVKLAYTEEILERPAGAKRSTKLKRVYETAQKVKEGKKETLPYQGKTVVIEKKGDTYVFTADGEKLSEEDAEDLDKEFNKKDDADRVENEDFLPKKPVKLNEAWAIDAAKLAKSFGSEAPFELDPAQSKATGKLIKAYKKDGRQFGVIQVTIDFTPTEFKAGGDTIPLKKGSKLGLVVTIDACIDGTSHDGDAKMAVTINIEGEIPNGTLKIVGDSQVTETGREVK